MHVVFLLHVSCLGEARTHSYTLPEQAFHQIVNGDVGAAGPKNSLKAIRERHQMLQHMSLYCYVTYHVFFHIYIIYMLQSMCIVGRGSGALVGRFEGQRPVAEDLNTCRGLPGAWWSLDQGECLLSGLAQGLCLRSVEAPRRLHRLSATQSETQHIYYIHIL